jgi:ABC-type enterochelin transport system substrate-binding protein
MTIRHPASTYRPKEQRQKEALERQALRDSLTHQQQLEKLDKIFGEGEGAAKERKRLLSLIEPKNESPKTSKKKKKKG